MCSWFLACDLGRPNGHVHVLRRLGGRKWQLRVWCVACAVVVHCLQAACAIWFSFLQLCRHPIIHPPHSPDLVFRPACTWDMLGSGVRWKPDTAIVWHIRLRCHHARRGKVQRDMQCWLYWRPCPLRCVQRQRLVGCDGAVR